jgi:hypothetical protein
MIWTFLRLMTFDLGRTKRVQISLDCNNNAFFETGDAAVGIGTFVVPFLRESGLLAQVACELRRRSTL